jgi:threonylcarbamoyladenosine tRNA methylthiotransferase MtaB
VVVIVSNISTIDTQPIDLNQIEMHRTDTLPTVEGGVAAANTALSAKKTCRVVTLGCRVNQYESQLVLETLERNGYRQAVENESADLCVVNTCTVTSNGDSRSRQLIRQLARDNPGTQTLVMGCYATRDPEAVRRLPSVFEVVTDKRELPDVLGRYGVVDLPSGISRFPGRKRAYVKLQDGCILRCSYCIIPQVRPGLRSRPAAEIEAEVRRLLDAGHLELVLTGIHVGHYGVESSRQRMGQPPFRLWHLLRQLDRIPGPWRMRLSSIEAAEMPAEFLSAAADCEHLCPHFHPALQSGSNTVLQRMRRRYTAEQFLRTVDQLRERLDRPSFSTDVIVGFPGETDAEFEETVQVCEAAEFSKIHVFPFSPRRGTPAAQMTDQVPGTVVADRVRRLELLEQQLQQRYAQRFVGSELEVMVEGSDPDRPGSVVGTDRRYLTVTLPGNILDRGRLVRVQAARTDGMVMVSERVDEASVELAVNGVFGVAAGDRVG